MSKSYAVCNPNGDAVIREPMSADEVLESLRIGEFTSPVSIRDQKSGDIVDMAELHEAAAKARPKKSKKPAAGPRDEEADGMGSSDTPQPPEQPEG